MVPAGQAFTGICRWKKVSIFWGGLDSRLRGNDEKGGGASTKKVAAGES